VLAGFSLTTLACNGILGISDYKRGECSGGGVCTDGGFADGPVEDASTDDRPDVRLADASGTKPVSWAQFVMPNYAQDGGPGENIPTYAATDGGFVDSVSNLVWSEPIAPADKGLKSYERAQTICASLGGGKWRLPSRIELVTLLDLSRSGVRVDPTFSSTEALQYWTSSEVRVVGGAGSGEQWTVDFGAGGVGKQNAATGTGAVRCIKDR
jgi:hypothetical protein